MKKDLKKLRDYAKKLNCKIKIYYRKHQEHDATFAEDRTITLYFYSGLSQVERAMALLHELGHAEDHEDLGGKWPQKERDVLSKETHTKHERRLIYQLEKRAIDKMFGIAKKLELSIPLQRIELEQLMDEFTYYHYWKRNGLPSRSMRKRVNAFYRQWLGI